ncbi:putative Transposon Tf2-1 polyprotein, partial [Rhizoctonia solani 123E]
PEANERTNLILQIQEEVAGALRLSKERMTKGKPEEPPISFEVGEKAWLDAKNINLKSTSSKLNDRRLGPFKVIEKISNLAYRLELPESMRVHNVFYLGLPSKVKEDPKTPFKERPPPVTIEGEEEYEVEAIVDHKREGDQMFYKIKWKGYGPESNTWEPKENLENAENFLKKYHSMLLKKAHDAAKGLRGGAVLQTTQSKHRGRS